MFKIFIHKEAFNEFNKLHPAFKYAIVEFARKLTRSHIPADHDVRKIDGIDSAYYVRIGRYEVFYEVEILNGKINIIHIRKASG